MGNRKSPRFRVSSPKIGSIPTFDLLTQTPPPPRRKKETIVVIEIKSTPRKDTKRKGKEMSTSKSKNVTGDSDFEEESEHPKAKKRSKIAIGETSKNKKIEKAQRSKKKKKNNSSKKNTKQQTHWCSYTNVNASEKIKTRLNDSQLKMFRDFPFGLFLDLPKLKVQPQLLRSLMYVKTYHDRNDMFIIKVNGKELHFGIREFAIITSLKCGMDIEFVSKLDSPNRLINVYFNGLFKVSKPMLVSIFIDFKNNKALIDDAYIFKILIFINIFSTDEKMRTINFSELPQEIVIDEQVPTESDPSIHGSEFKSLKKEVANLNDMKAYMDKSFEDLLKDIKFMFGKQTETEKAKGSDSVKDNTEEPKTSNK
ncbi:hypothetical protein RND71_003359 [Anisodus tanguticus]|uniref:DUF1985 domain-containing protein n=1 Tax=Anisodus tanguticus TaxID=243964 RepID=A0AAE1VNM5_9SOLA|nr:hypothetical protein RND71_003359 [Anisodus tanguticus]